MKKLAMIAAAALAAGVALFTYPQGLASPPSPEALAEADQAAVDRAVERHLGSILRHRLLDLQEERAWALGLR